MDLEKLQKALDDDMKNPNGFFSKLVKKNEINSIRQDKFEKWLETNEFEPFFKKLLKRNGEDRGDYCYKNGCEKYGTPLMEFLCSYITDRVDATENHKFNNDFSSGVWFFKDYWFQLICGQGCFWRIYDKDLNCIEDI